MADDKAKVKPLEPDTAQDAGQKQPPETNGVTTESDVKKDEAERLAKAEEDAKVAEEEAKAAEDAKKSEKKAPKTKTYYARLVRGMFEQPHRRGNYVFETGPTAVEVELTAAEKQEMDDDPGIEFIEKGDAKKLADAADVTASIEGDNAAENGRNYQ